MELLITWGRWSESDIFGLWSIQLTPRLSTTVHFQRPFQSIKYDVIFTCKYSYSFIPLLNSTLFPGFLQVHTFSTPPSLSLSTFSLSSFVAFLPKTKPYLTPNLPEPYKFPNTYLYNKAIVNSN